VGTPGGGHQRGHPQADQGAARGGPYVEVVVLEQRLQRVGGRRVAEQPEPFGRVAPPRGRGRAERLLQELELAGPGIGAEPVTTVGHGHVGPVGALLSPANGHPAQGGQRVPGRVQHRAHGITEQIDERVDRLEPAEPAERLRGLGARLGVG